MLKAVSVFLGGSILGIALLLGLFLGLVYHLPGGVNFYSFFALEATVGVAVGLFVGFAQRDNAGFLAPMCLLPFLLWSLARPHSPLWVGGRFPVFVLGETLSLLMAFIVAHRLSKVRNRARLATPGSPPNRTSH
jgi:hypothetical protein